LLREKCPVIISQSLLEIDFKEHLMRFVFPDNNEFQISQTPRHKRKGIFEVILVQPNGVSGAWSSVIIDRQSVAELRQLLSSQKNGLITRISRFSRHSISISGGSIKTLEVYRWLFFFGFEITAVSHSVNLNNEQSDKLAKWLASSGFCSKHRQ
jgi:hypothetical protein